MFRNYALLLSGLSLIGCGCSTSRSASYGRSCPYGQNVYAQTTTYRQQPVCYAGGVVVENNQGVAPSRPATSKSQVSSAFTRKLATMKSKQAAAQQAAQAKERQQALKERERRITDFLWKNEIPGVSDTRVLLKNTINDADRKLKTLASDLRLAGQAPESDSTYLEIKNKRNRLRSNLAALDDKIMDAIVSKSAGSAAEAVSISASESANAATARANLQSAASQYKIDTEQIIRSANW